MASPADVDLQRWPVAQPCIVLGHRVAPDGSSAPSWRHTSAAMWRAYWKSAGQTGITATNLRRAALLREVAPILDFHSGGWALTRTLLKQVDAMHRSMTALSMRLAPRPSEPIDIFHRRRCREAARHIGNDRWGRRAQQRVVNWGAHLRRPANAASPAARVLRFHDRLWLQNLRVQRGSRTSAAGQTGTRRFPGQPALRWEDGEHAALADGVAPHVPHGVQS